MGEILIGILSGIASGTGMGGGIILIFLLTFFIGVDQYTSQATNLIFFIPTAIVSIIVNLKNKNIDIKLGIIITIFGVLGAVLGAKISTHININILRKCFGFFLAIITINEIYTIFRLYRKANKNIKKIDNK